MEGLVIRMAREEDASAIADIYNHYIETSTATFDTVPKTLEDRVAWLEAHDDRHPVIVAETAEGIVGWGSLSPWATRPAWSRTVEVSVYVADTHRGGGVGPALLDELVNLGRIAGHHALIAQIVGDNKPSLEMSARAGFELVGVLKEVGFKLDRWLDVALVELVLPERTAVGGDSRATLLTD